MYCTNCGAPIADDARFCIRCGWKAQRPDAMGRPPATAAPAAPSPALSRAGVPSRVDRLDAPLAKYWKTIGAWMVVVATVFLLFVDCWPFYWSFHSPDDEAMQTGAKVLSKTVFIGGYLVFLSMLRTGLERIGSPSVRLAKAALVTYGTVLCAVLFVLVQVWLGRSTGLTEAGQRSVEVASVVFRLASIVSFATSVCLGIALRRHHTGVLAHAGLLTALLGAWDVLTFLILVGGAMGAMGADSPSDGMILAIDIVSFFATVVWYKLTCILLPKEPAEATGASDGVESVDWSKIYDGATGWLFAAAVMIALLLYIKFGHLLPD